MTAPCAVVVKTYDPLLDMQPEATIVPVGANPAEFATERALEDGAWIAGLTDPETGWGLAHYGDYLYLWSGPYPTDDPDLIYQLDTFQQIGATA